MFRMFVNAITLVLVLYSSFNFHKYKKESPELKKHYSYYFIIMCIYLAIDAQLSFLTGLVPFYQVIKLLTVIWLSMPIFAGPVFIYKYYLGSIFRVYGDKIECLIQQIKSKLKELLGNTYEKTRNRIKKKEETKENEENVLLKEIESNIHPGDLPESE